MLILRPEGQMMVGALRKGMGVELGGPWTEVAVAPVT